MMAAAERAVLSPRLSRAVAAAVRRARSRGEALVAVTAPAPRMDPAQVALASRRPGEPYFLFEQPDRGRHALAALGCIRALEAEGPERFARVGRDWRRLAAEANADQPDALVAVGGFAFAPDGGGSPQWQGFAPASLHIPGGAPPRRGADGRA